MEPLICTRNRLFHIDYGTPIVANKSTDYRSQKTCYHDYIPEYPQEFDCRVKSVVTPEQLQKSVDVKDYCYTTTYVDNYYPKATQVDPKIDFNTVPNNQKVTYSRNVQEKLFAKPCPPIKPGISEMKGSYGFNFYHPNHREVYPPALTMICNIEGLGRDEQPAIRPEEQGYWKWLDPYLTTNRATYLPFSEKTQIKALEDLPTIYNVEGKHKGFTGVLPTKDGNNSIYDKMTFKHMIPNRITLFAKRIPESAKKSEYQDKYIKQSFSDLYPYIQVPLEPFCDSLSKSSAWQDLCAPGMYCTEYCHIGTGWPISSVINNSKTLENVPTKSDSGEKGRQGSQGNSQKNQNTGIVHKPCFIRVQ